MKRCFFTVIELTVTIGVIAVLAGISIGVASYVGNKNKETQTKSAMQLIRMALENYKQEFGAYPFYAEGSSSQTLDSFKIYGFRDETGAVALTAVQNKANLWGCFKDVQLDSNSKPVGIRGLKLVLKNNYYHVVDGWNNDFIYIYPGIFNQMSYDLISRGPNGKIAESGTDVTVSAIKTAYGSPVTPVDDLTNFAN